ncbi:MAG: PUA domain-containing protein [Sulfolobales archaeon]|nr:pseudouridine synthase [Sulfolobales archaeon]MCX8209105.1 pseudouridine synthase [Sulfolobales archaeon]MDW8010253.1 PUA domain-containing protein [Sulfolobales archaeon]
MYLTRPATRDEVSVLRSIADYQFGFGIGARVVPDSAYLRISRATRRIRAVLDESGRVLFTVRAYTHTLIPSIYGALLIHRATSYPKLRCVVVSEVAEDLVKYGSSVFSRHVLYVDEGLRPGDEVLVVDESDGLLCVGTLRLSPVEVLDFIRGSAVRLRACRGD